MAKKSLFNPLMTIGIASVLLTGCTVWTNSQAKEACMKKLESMERKSSRQRIIVDEAKSTEKAESWGDFMKQIESAGSEVVFRRFIGKARSQAGKMMGSRQKDLGISRVVYIRYMRQHQSKANGPWVDRAYMVATCVAYFDKKKDRTITDIQQHIYSDT